MYADKDIRGFMSLMELDRPSVDCIAAALKQSLKVWKISLDDFRESSNRQLDLVPLQRKIGLENRIRIAEKIIREIESAKNIKI